MFACKKHKLEGDKSIFVGTWNWAQSEHKYGICTGDPPIEEIITPSTEGFNYSMEFLEKGIVKFYKNGKYLERDRIVFSVYEPNDGDYEFAINLNNDSGVEGTFNGYVNQDTLTLVHGFPHELDPDGCETYVSYFVKE
jgi:hypothetical protein